MDTQFIECKSIEFPKLSAEDRSFKKEFCDNLADAIKETGQLQPILVRPHPKPHGKIKYEGVDGRHRHHAVGKILKRDLIECKVDAEMTDEEANLARTAANLWRNPLTKPQHLKAIRVWWDHFREAHPDKVGKGNYQTAEKTEKAKADEVLKDGIAPEAQVGPLPEPEEPNAPVASFAKTVSAATGQPLTSTKRSASLAKQFTPEQWDAFAAVNTSETDIRTISKIEDESERASVVNLVASGMKPDDAIADVMKDRAPTRAWAGETKEQTEAKAKVKAEAVPDLSDDEWFETYCGDKARLLGNPARFKADALLFRWIADQRHTFRLKVKKHLAATKAGKITGSFFHLINRLISAAHPKDWFLCDKCRGTGMNEEGGACKPCGTGGYVVRMEEYL